MTSLQTLDINTNRLSGELPDSISDLSGLNLLSVYTNNFSGSVPKDFGKNSPLLSSVGFANNSFPGELPSGLCSQNLEEFDNKWEQIQWEVTRLLEELHKAKPSTA